MRVKVSQVEGFTLVEVLVVILLMGLMAGLVASNFGRDLEAVRLKAEVRRLAALLRGARGEAAYRGVTVKIDFLQREGKACYTMDEETRCLPEGMHIQELKEGDELNIIFYPNGSGRGGPITIVDARRRGYLIEIDPITGYVGLRRV